VLDLSVVRNACCVFTLCNLPFRTLSASLQDYAELVIQFGFVVLFSLVFPATPLIAYASNCMEFHVDAYKMLNCSRR
jgi:hypothetical protein